MSDLKDKIESGNARLAVIGMGYVGLPPAVELARCGVATTGTDATAEKDSQINAVRSSIGEYQPGSASRRALV